MIEVCLFFNFYKGVDEDSYSEWAKKAIVHLLKSPGIIEFKANRNLLGTPQVRLSTTWKSLGDWSKFGESEKWIELMGELSKNFATDIKMNIWGASPIAPGPLHPST